MGLFDRLDPTRGWPVVSGPAPDLSRIRQPFDTLRFGDPIEGARPFGLPDRLEWRNRLRGDCDLLYAKKGFRLRFTQGKLREVAYLIGPGASDHPDFAPARPAAPDGTRLTGEVDKAQIVALFGEPDPGGSDDECLQVFHGNGVVSDFFLDERGHLKEWALYPDE